MKITPALGYQFDPCPPGCRSPGIHLSGILQYLAIQLNLYDEPEIPLSELFALHNTPAGFGSNPTLTKIAMGFAWEEYLSRRLPRVSFHPFELCIDDIYMTIDGLELPMSGPPILHEIKSTYYSTNKDLEKTTWIWQCAGYLYGLSQEFGEQCTVAVLHPLHLRGNYRDEFPLYPATRVEFEWPEIESYWRMIESHKHFAVAEKGE